MNLKNVCNLVDHFKDSDSNIEDEHRTGRPVEVWTPSLQQWVNEMIIITAE